MISWRITDACRPRHRRGEFVGFLERHALRRGDLASVEAPVAAIRRLCDGWNQRRQPFTWTRAADRLLATLRRRAVGSGPRQLA